MVSTALHYTFGHVIEEQSNTTGKQAAYDFGLQLIIRGGESCPREERSPLDRQANTCLSSSVGDLFEAIATPARRAILDELVERDGQTLFELCARLAMRHEIALSRQAISQHLDVLQAAGLVIARRQGKYKFHYRNTGPLEEIAKRWVKPAAKKKPAKGKRP
jgi:DNA-binding transcriptional ArsR family regulator